MISALKVEMRLMTKLQLTRQINKVKVGVKCAITPDEKRVKDIN